MCTTPQAKRRSTEQEYTETACDLQHIAGRALSAMGFFYKESFSDPTNRGRGWSEAPHACRPPSVLAGGAGGKRDEETLEAAAVDFAAAARDGRCHRTVRLTERALIVQALQRHAGNQSEAATYLGLHRNTLRNKIRELGILARG